MESTWTPNLNCDLENQSTTSSDNVSTRKRIPWFQRVYGGSEAPSVTFSPSDANIVDELWTEEPIDVSKNVNKIMRYVKIVLLLILWTAFTVILWISPEHHTVHHLLTVPAVPNELIINNTENIIENQLSIQISGAFLKQAIDVDQKHAFRKTTEKNFVRIELLHLTNSGESKTIAQPFVIHTKLNMNSPMVSRKNDFIIFGGKAVDKDNIYYRLTTNLDEDVPVELVLRSYPSQTTRGVIYAFVLLLILYTLLATGLVHRALAAILCSTFAISFLGLTNQRPEIVEIMTWVDSEMLMLLLCLIIVVSVCIDTGIVDYIAVVGYEYANGHIWPVITAMYITAVLLSICLISPPIILLMTPITVRISEVLKINPIPVLISLISSTNIAAALAPLRERKITSIEEEIMEQYDIDHFDNMLHLIIPVLLALLQTYFHLRIHYHNSDKMRFQSTPEIERLKHLINVWRRAGKTASAYSKGEQEMKTAVNTKVRSLRIRVKRLGKKPIPTDDYQETLAKLKQTYPIKNKPLLIKCGIVFFILFVQVFVHSLPYLNDLTMCWASLQAVILLLIIADIEDMEGLLSKVEWSMLLFFAALMVFNESLLKLGFTDFIHDHVYHFVEYFHREYHLLVAMLTLICVAAFLSIFFLDQLVFRVLLHILIDFTAILHLPINPLLYAVILGTYFGNNATIVSGTSNIVGVSILEQHGYTVSFFYYMKILFPITIGNILIASVYLIVAHYVYAWH